MESRRQEITNQLKKRQLDCLICLLPVVKGMQSCTNCFQIYHYDCLKKWTVNRKTCPNCVEFIEPIDSCFCGKGTDLSCGQTCLVKLECNHKCLLKCHPGPHDCTFAGKNYCKCRRYFVLEKCSAKGDDNIADGVVLQRNIDNSLFCNQKCLKIMKCGHLCQKLCCEKCECLQVMSCFCTKSSKMMDYGSKFSCGQECGFVYDCGHGKSMTESRMYPNLS